MIAHLRGKLIEKEPSRLVIEANGVGYEVFVPLSTYTAMPSPGAEVSLDIHTHVREDIMALANSFLRRFAAQANRVIKGFTASAAERITNFDWPGNVRQLQNEVQRAVLLSEGEQIDATDLSITSVRTSSEGGGDTNFTLLEGVERNEILVLISEKGATGPRIPAGFRRRGDDRA